MSGPLQTLGTWFADYLVLASVVLLGSSALMALMRQPARRLTVVWAVGGSLVLLVACVTATPWPRVALIPVARNATSQASGFVEEVAPLPPQETFLDRVATAVPRENAADVATRGERQDTTAAPSRTASPAPFSLVSLAEETPPGIRTQETVLGKWLAALGGVGLAAAVALIARNVLGLFLTRRLLMSCHSAPGGCGKLLAHLPDPTGYPQLLISDRARQPFSLGPLRPRIILPLWLFESAREAELRAAVVHEWDHIRRGDLWLLALWRWLAPVLALHPLFWWVRRQAQLDQEILADAMVVHCTPPTDPVDYSDILVGWARRLTARPWAAVGLPAVSHEAFLKRRIAMLLNEKRVELDVARTWRRTAWLGMAAVALVLSVFTLFDQPALPGAEAADEASAEGPTAPPVETSPGKPAADEPDALAQVTRDDGSLVFRCRIVDRETSKGIPGATVVVRRTVPSIGPGIVNDLIGRTEATTDSDGRWTATFPANEVELRRLYVELDVTHPDYPPKKGFGYALSMTKKNLILGERPFFETVMLRTGKEVTGVVRTPGGKPAEGVRVLGYSNIPDWMKQNEYGSFAEATTDAAGKFRFVAITPGKCVFWIIPERYAPSAHFIDARRGDVGKFTMSKGIVLKGRVLDADGEPLAGVFLEARGTDRSGHGMPVMSGIGRNTESDRNGTYRFDPLPADECEILVEWSQYDRKTQRSRRREPIAVFYHKKVQVSPERNPHDLDIQAVPHVTLELRYVDSDGEPSSGWDVHLWGDKPPRGDDRSADRRREVWWTQGRVCRDKENLGKVKMLVPKGLVDARLDLIANEHGALQFQMHAFARKQGGRRVSLGTIDSDLRGMRIIRYKAPVVIFRVKRPDGELATDVEIEGRYDDSDIGKSVRFEEQQHDGRYRSSQLLPDERVTYTVTCKGYHPIVTKLSGLREGEVREIDVELAPAESNSGPAVFAPVTPK